MADEMVRENELHTALVSDNASAALALGNDVRRDDAAVEFFGLAAWPNGQPVRWGDLSPGEQHKAAQAWRAKRAKAAPRVKPPAPPPPPPPPPREPPPSTWLKVELLETFADKLAERFRAFVDSTVAPMRQRFASLASRQDAIESRVVTLGERGSTLNYAGVWRAEETYKRGQCVTRDGGLWVALKDAAVTEKPGACDAWKLAVKRGDVGARGPEGPPGPPGDMPRHRWIEKTKLQFEQGPTGEDWGDAVDLQGPAGPGGGGGGVVTIVQQVTRNTYDPSGW